MYGEVEKSQNRIISSEACLSIRKTAQEYKDDTSETAQAACSSTPFLDYVDLICIFLPKIVSSEKVSPAWKRSSIEESGSNDPDLFRFLPMFIVMACASN